MADQLENKLVEAITDITANLAQAKSFVLSELPDVLQQYLLFNTIKSCGYTVLGLVLIIACTYTIYKLTRNNDWLENDVAFFILSLLLGIIGGIIFCTNFIEAIQLVVAPKVWLLEHLSYIIKSLK